MGHSGEDSDGSRTSSNIHSERTQIVLRLMRLNGSQIALFVIGSAGFGKKMSWKDSGVRPAGRKMNFQVHLWYFPH